MWDDIVDDNYTALMKRAGRDEACGVALRFGKHTEDERLERGPVRSVTDDTVFDAVLDAVAADRTYPCARLESLAWVWPNTCPLLQSARGNCSFSPSAAMELRLALFSPSSGT